MVPKQMGAGMVGKRRGKYRKAGDVQIDGETVAGLRRRPDGRFYSKKNPSRGFGKHPIEAIIRFAQWQWEQEGCRYGLSVCPEIKAALRSLSEDELRSSFGLDQPPPFDDPQPAGEFQMPSDLEIDPEALKRWPK